jgi:FKBP-type peptidyl-prolyl cis-trans isomerase FklB
MLNMRRTLCVGALVACGVAACAGSLRSGAAGAAPTTAQPAQPQEGQLAYAIGYFLGGEVRAGMDADGVQANIDQLVAGFSAAVRSADPALSQQEMEQALAQAHEAVQDRIVQRRLEQDATFREHYEANLARSQAFHETFASQPGVQTLASGAQYRPLRQGSGDAAGPGATVVVTFTGALLDGHVFAEGEAVEISLSTVTPGVREVVGAMRPGDWWQIAIPPQLAYGGFGRPDAGIGPNETLLGDVKLLEVR